VEHGFAFLEDRSLVQALEVMRTTKVGVTDGRPRSRPAWSRDLDRDPVLAEIIRRLVSAYQPERIYLFGSRARGDAKADSDYDLLVVVPESATLEQRDSRRAYEVLTGVGASKDVVIMTRDDYHRMLGAAASLPATVEREGRRLYGT